MLRRNRLGQAARWVVKQGPVSLVLHTMAFAAFTVGAFTLAAWAGCLVLGGCCLWMETNTREADRP